MSVLLLVDAGVGLGVDLDVVVLCVYVLWLYSNGMGVPASPSGVFRLRCRSGLRQTAAEDFPSASLTLASRYRSVPDLCARVWLSGERHGKAQTPRTVPFRRTLRFAT